MLQRNLGVLDLVGSEEKSRRRMASRTPVLLTLMHEVRLVQLRWFLRSFMASVTASFFGVFALHTVVLKLMALRSVGFEASFDWLSLGGVGALGIGIALGVSWWRMPSERAMIEFIDDQCDLESRLITAFDLESERPRHHASRAMHQALLRDVRKKASRVRADQIMPIRFPPLFVLVPLGLFIFFVAIDTMDSWTPRRTALSLREGESSLNLDEARRRELITELDALADAVEEEAGDNDPYTRALAEATRNLAHNLREGELTGNVPDVAEEVQHLLAHLDVALGSYFLPPEGRNARAASPLAGAPRNAVSGDPSDASPAVIEQPQFEEADTTNALDDVRFVRARLEMVQSQRMNTLYGGAFGSDQAQSDRQQEPGLLADSTEGVKGAPVGAAERSTVAAGDAAGDGSQALYEGDRGQAMAFDEGEDISLPQAAPGDGARVGIRGNMEASAEVAASVIGRGTSEGEGRVGSLQGDDLPIVERDSVRRDAGAWRKEALDPYARLTAQRLFEPEARE